MAPDGVLGQQEVFGPVLAATRFDGIDEAVAIANGTDYGLVAGIWTADGARQMRLAKAVRVGQVRAAQWAVERAETRLHERIREAAAAGVSERRLAEASGISRMKVRRIIGRD